MGSSSNTSTVLDRVLALEIARVTERAAVAAAYLRGRGDEKAAEYLQALDKKFEEREKVVKDNLNKYEIRSEKKPVYQKARIALELGLAEKALQVLLDSRPTASDRAAGRVTLYDLSEQGRTSTVDVRKATGDRSLTTDWVAFDPQRPGTLRVVSGLTVWVVPTGGGSATREGVLPSRPGWVYAGGFNKNDGQPYIEDTDSFRTVPKGNGDLDTRAPQPENRRRISS